MRTIGRHLGGDFVTSETIHVAADILRVEGLCKSFGEAVVLDDVSFSVASNSIVGIVGENGAGKSTLFNIISGIVRPDRGRIEYRGKEIHPGVRRRIDWGLAHDEPWID